MLNVFLQQPADGILSALTAGAETRCQSFIMSVKLSIQVIIKCSAIRSEVYAERECDTFQCSYRDAHAVF